MQVRGVNVENEKAKSLAAEEAQLQTPVVARKERNIDLQVDLEKTNKDPRCCGVEPTHGRPGLGDYQDPRLGLVGVFLWFFLSVGLGFSLVFRIIKAQKGLTFPSRF
jgi:hypothetical protein